MVLLHFHADGTKLCTVQRHSGNHRFGKRAAIGAADQRTDFGLANVSLRRDRAGGLQSEMS